VVTKLLKKLARKLLKWEMLASRAELGATKALLSAHTDRLKRIEASAAALSKRVNLIATWIEYVYRGDAQTSEHRAIVEYLRYGANGFAPKQMGVHPLKRYDRWPMPEDVERLVNEQDERRAAA